MRHIIIIFYRHAPYPRHAMPLLMSPRHHARHDALTSVTIIRPQHDYQKMDEREKEKDMKNETHYIYEGINVLLCLPHFLLFSFLPVTACLSFSSRFTCMVYT